MQQVTREKFFATVGALNVSPHVNLASLKRRHFESDWIMNDGTRRLVGRTISDSHGAEPTRFFVEERA